MESSTHVDTSKYGRNHTREGDRWMHAAREIVGAPTSRHREKRSPDRYIGYMALMTELVETKPSSFEEAVEKPIWVDAMVEEYKSIVKNNVWEVILRT